MSTTELQRGILFRGAIHRRRQLSAHRRAIGGKVPARPGPSADTPMDP